MTKKVEKDDLAVVTEIIKSAEGNNKALDDKPALNTEIEFKKNMLDLMNSQLEEINDRKQFIKLVETRLRSMLENDDLSPNQVINIWNSFASKNNESMSNIMSFLKPTNNGNSNFIFEVAEGEKDDVAKNIHTNLSIEQTTAIDKLNRLLQKMEESEDDD